MLQSRSDRVYEFSFHFATTERWSHILQKTRTEPRLHLCLRLHHFDTTTPACTAPGTGTSMTGHYTALVELETDHFSSALDRLRLPSACTVQQETEAKIGRHHKKATGPLHAELLMHARQGRKGVVRQREKRRLPSPIFNICPFF